MLELYRVARGYSGSELARQLGMSIYLIPRIERGGLPAWPRLRSKLSEFFGVDEDILFESDGHARKVPSDAVISLLAKNLGRKVV